VGQVLSGGEQKGTIDVGVEVTQVADKVLDDQASCVRSETMSRTKRSSWIRDRTVDIILIPMFNVNSVFSLVIPRAKTNPLISLVIARIGKQNSQLIDQTLDQIVPHLGKAQLDVVVSGDKDHTVTALQHSGQRLQK
jgi:sporulation protein YlmC with PRC-barrel domain